MDAAAPRRLEAAFRELQARARRSLDRQDLDTAHAVVQRRARLHYQGTDTLLELDADDLATLRERFEQRYRARFGFAHSAPVVAEELYVELTGGGPRDAGRTAGEAPTAAVAASDRPRRVRVYLDGRFRRIPLYQYARLRAGTRIDGPALIVEAHGTTFVEPGWPAPWTPTPI